MSKPSYDELKKQVQELKKKITALEEENKILKKVEKTIQESQFRYEEIFNLFMEHSPIYVFFKDENIRSVKLSKNYEKMIGMPLNELIGKSMDDLFPSELAKSMIEADKRVLREGKPITVRETLEGKTYDTIKFPIIIDGTPRFLAGFTIDVTEQIQAEEALKMSEKRYGSIVENLNDALYIFDFNGHILDVNEIACRMLGYSREELIGAHLTMIDSPENAQLIPVHMQELHDKGTTVFDAEHVRKDRSLVPINASAKIVSRDGNGIIQSFVRDITERKRAEDILRKSEKNLVEAQRIAHLGSFEYDFHTNTLFWSDEIFRIFGISPDKFSGNIEDFLNIIHPDDKEQVRSLREESLLQGGKGDFEHRIIRSDGSIRIVHERYETFFAEDGRPLYRTGTVQDITDQKKAEEEKKNLEEQLFQSQKMESIGRLSGGVAHDFNNILTSIMGYAELLQMQFGDRSTQEGQAVDIIINGAERAADLTQQLLGFARGGKYNPVPLKINEVIKECIKVSEKIFEKNVTVKYQLFENIDTIEADKNQMHQVLTNIIINARDAMPDSGNILISTENVFIDREYVTNHPEFKIGQYIKISISDTGIGMPKVVKDRIFEPFYTTKGQGKGTGLGLATVYGIIKNHNGYIHVYSEPGIGTTFSIYLPISGKEIIEEQKEQKVLKGDATVLIVDDEENIRVIIQKQLESLGYKVIIAADGKEAVAIVEEKKDEIDLVLLDLIMPNMAGREAFHEIKKIKPDIKVVLVSGFSQNGKASEILREGALGFIQKPFKLYELSKIINETLQRK